MIWIILLIFYALYIRTVGYYQLLDDFNPRSQYPIPPKETIHPKYYFTKSKWYARVFIVSMYAVNVYLVYLLFGWPAALLYAVHPMSVWGAAWNTGNYYATTTLFALTAYYFLNTFPNVYGTIASIIFYACCVNSTLEGITLPFLFLIFWNPLGLTWFIPMVQYLTGSRFKAALGSRMAINKGKKYGSHGFPLNRLIFMTKVVARYTFYTLVPMKVSFFAKWGECVRDYPDVYERLHKADKEFWASLAIILTVLTAGLLIYPFGIMWFFVAIVLHSQFNLVGQTFAQRYIQLPMVGMVAVIGHLLAPYPEVVWAIAGFLACRTHLFIPNWLNMETLLQNEVAVNPERGDSHSTLAQFYFAIKPLAEYPRWMINRISMLIRRAVELDPRSWQASMNYAAFIMMVGRIEESIAATERTIELMEKVANEADQVLLDKLKQQKINHQNLLVDFKKQMKAERNKK